MRLWLPQEASLPGRSSAKHRGDLAVGGPAPPVPVSCQVWEAGGGHDPKTPVSTGPSTPHGSDVLHPWAERGRAEPCPAPGSGPRVAPGAPWGSRPGSQATRSTGGHRQPPVTPALTGHQGRRGGPRRAANERQGGGIQPRGSSRASTSLLPSFLTCWSEPDSQLETWVGGSCVSQATGCGGTSRRPRGWDLWDPALACTCSRGESHRGQDGKVTGHSWPWAAAGRTGTALPLSRGPGPPCCVGGSSRASRVSEHGCHPSPDVGLCSGTVSITLKEQVGAGLAT